MNKDIAKLEAMDKHVISELDVAKSFVESGDYSWAILKLQDLERVLERANNLSIKLADAE